MRKMVLFAFLTIVILLPLSGPMVVQAKAQPKALILSSLEKHSPMGHLDAVTQYLTSTGYNVTFISDTRVTIKLLTTGLNDYDVVIWRTDVYQRARTTYWYVGESAHQETLHAYASSLAVGWIDATNGILGVSVDFFRNNFGQNSLANVKVAILVSSMSISIANAFVKAGAKATVDYYASFTAPSSLFDYVTQSLVQYLAAGNTVNDSIAKTMNNFAIVGTPEDSYLPPISYLGDGTTTII